MKDDITNRQLLDALTDQLGVITDNMVTKHDLKEDLRAAKDELKSELERATTRLERRISANYTANVEHHLATRAEIGALHKKAW